MVAWSTPPAERRVSEEEFLSLPESHEHVELIDGEVIVAAAPRPLHQIVVSRLHVVLARWAEEHPPAFVGLSPFDVRLAPGRIVQPDLFVLLGGLPSLAAPVTVTPDLVVEVLSHNRSYDRLTKRVVYAEAGVREYWLIDPDERRGERVDGGGPLERIDDRLASVACAGLVVDLAALFR